MGGVGEKASWQGGDLAVQSLVSNCTIFRAMVIRMEGLCEPPDIAKTQETSTVGGKMGRGGFQAYSRPRADIGV